MKVAFYNHTSVVSGAEISLLLTAKHMTEAVPVVFAPEGELLERAREAQLATVSIPSYRARLSRNPFQLLKGMLGMAVAGYRFAQAIRKHEVDLVHANSLRAGMMAGLFGWLHKKPVVMHIRDNPPGGIVGAMIHFVSNKTIAAAIGISKAVTDRFHKSKLGDRLHLIHNGVELRTIPPAAKLEHRLAIRQHLDTPAESKTLVIIGQIAPWKRQEDAIRAAASLIELGRDVYLWIVGEAKFREENMEYERNLRRLAVELKIGDRVRFAGFRKDVMEVCCAADLLLLCSDNEPFGRVLIEAMSQALPVVATRAGGVPEIVVHGESGLLYEIGDVIGLTRHVDKLLTEAELRANMGEAAKERVERQFTIQNTVRKVERLYRDVLGTAAGTREPDAQSGDNLRVAIVHDYLNQMGGAERVVGVLHRMFPDAPIYTTILDREKLLPELRDADIRVTWAQRIPGILKRFKLFFWLYPFAVSSIKLKGYDIIISSSSAYAKGARRPKGSIHLSYCHTPMRFAWDFATYMEGVKVPALLKWVAGIIQIPLRLWDKKTTAHVDYLIANSTIVQQRIRHVYNRPSKIIYPPVNVSRFEVNDAEADDYFLVVSRLVSYKRIDLAVEACTRLAKPLVIIGDGPDRARLEKLAGPSIRFMGRLADEEVVRFMQNCSAFLFPGLEDFGITPLEVNACGRPVISFQGGGALDTVVPGLNGMYFSEQTVESLMAVLEDWGNHAWDSWRIRRHAESFAEARFCSELSNYIAHAIRMQSGTVLAVPLPQPKWKGSVGS